jgi:hypothetical protein
MRALSIRQPWAWLILHAGKDVENRNWQPRNPNLRFRGTCYVHASLACEPIDADLRAFVQRVAGLDIPTDLPRGGIVGQVDVIDVVRASSSPWFSGPLGLLLANAKPLPFAPCRGALGFFKPALSPSHQSPTRQAPPILEACG